ncbi:MAG: hypothetical protein ACYTXI_38315 [Nostoc sp.]
MQKPLAYDRQGFADENLEPILPQTIPTNQIFLIYIRRRQLTNALEFLEKHGYCGDVAIFVLACCQEVAA